VPLLAAKLLYKNVKTSQKLLEPKYLTYQKSATNRVSTCRNSWHHSYAP